MSSSARDIIELNIEHYRERLRKETTVSTRRTIERLLRAEEARLAKLLPSVNTGNPRPPLSSPASESD
jgi:hypothetical protein